MIKPVHYVVSAEVKRQKTVQNHRCNTHVHQSKRSILDSEPMIRYYDTIERRAQYPVAERRCKRYSRIELNATPKSLLASFCTTRRKYTLVA